MISKEMGGGEKQVGVNRIFWNYWCMIMNDEKELKSEDL